MFNLHGYSVQNLLSGATTIIIPKEAEIEENCESTKPSNFVGNPLQTELKRNIVLDYVYCVLYGTQMDNNFGEYIRERRESLREKDSTFSVRQVASRIGVEPSYLSKVERGEQQPPSEEKIKSLAKELNENPDVLLALAGKVSSDLQLVIKQRPKIFAQLIRELKDMPDHAVIRIVREVRDGHW